VVAVERDRDRVGRRVDVAAREQGADQLGVRILGPHPDEDRLVVVEDREAGLERRPGRVLGKPLDEAGLPRRGGPDSLVELAVDRDRARPANRMRADQWRHVIRARGLLADDPDDPGNERDEPEPDHA